MISQNKNSYHRNCSYEKLKKTWSEINKVLNGCKYIQKDMYLCGNKTIITDSERVANKFNKYFINASHDLTNQRGETKSHY